MAQPHDLSGAAETKPSGATEARTSRELLQRFRDRLARTQRMLRRYRWA